MFFVFIYVLGAIDKNESTDKSYTAKSGGSYSYDNDYSYTSTKRETQSYDYDKGYGYTAPKNGESFSDYVKRQDPDLYDAISERWNSLK